MKKILLLVLLGTFGFSLQSKAAFKLSKSKITVDVTTANEDLQRYIFIKNTGSGKINLKWNLSYSDVTKDTSVVQYTICDNMSCYGQSQLNDTKDMGAINSGDSGYFKFDIFARKKPSANSSKMVLTVFDPITSAQDSLVIIVNYSQTAIDNQNNEYQKALVQSISTEYFNLNPVALPELKTISFLSSDGKMMYNSLIQNGNASINITGLNSGMYIALMTMRDGRIVSKKFVK